MSMLFCSSVLAFEVARHEHSIYLTDNLFSDYSNEVDSNVFDHIPQDHYSTIRYIHNDELVIEFDASTSSADFTYYLFYKHDADPVWRKSKAIVAPDNAVLSIIIKDRTSFFSGENSFIIIRENNNTGDVSKSIKITTPIKLENKIGKVSLKNDMDVYIYSQDVSYIDNDDDDKVSGYIFKMDIDTRKQDAKVRAYAGIRPAEYDNFFLNEPCVIVDSASFSVSGVERDEFIIEDITMTDSDVASRRIPSACFERTDYQGFIGIVDINSSSNFVDTWKGRLRFGLEYSVDDPTNSSGSSGNGGSNNSGSSNLGGSTNQSSSGSSDGGGSIYWLLLVLIFSYSCKSNKLTCRYL